MPVCFLKKVVKCAASQKPNRCASTLIGVFSATKAAEMSATLRAFKKASALMPNSRCMSLSKCVLLINSAL